MKIEKRIEKVEKALQPEDDPIQGARNLARVYIFTGAYSADEFDSKVEEYVAQGITLNKVMDDIASQSPRELTP